MSSRRSLRYRAAGLSDPGRVRANDEDARLAAEKVAQELLPFAREQGVTLVILGKSRRPWWWRLLRRSPIDALARTGTGIDVLEIEASAPGT